MTRNAKAGPVTRRQFLAGFLARVRPRPGASGGGGEPAPAPFPCRACGAPVGESSDVERVLARVDVAARSAATLCRACRVSRMLAATGSRPGTRRRSDQP